MTKHNMQVFRLSPLFETTEQHFEQQYNGEKRAADPHLLLDGLLCPAVLASGVRQNAGMTTTCNETGVMLSKRSHVPDPQGIHPTNSQRVAATYVSPEQVDVGPQAAVGVADVLHHVLDGPLVGLPAPRCCCLLSVSCCGAGCTHPHTHNVVS